MNIVSAVLNSIMIFLNIVSMCVLPVAQFLITIAFLDMLELKGYNRIWPGVVKILGLITTLLSFITRVFFIFQDSSSLTGILFGVIFYVLQGFFYLLLTVFICVKDRNKVQNQIGTKSRRVDALLVLFFGNLGIHKFYENKIGLGFLYLITGGVFGIGTLCDLIEIISGSPMDYERNKIIEW